MSRKQFDVEQTINHLREAEVLLAQGQTVGEICRRIGVSEQSYYRRRRPRHRPEEVKNGHSRETGRDALSSSVQNKTIANHMR